MVIHEASLVYRVVREGPQTPLSEPPLVVDYMRGAFDTDPTVEWFYAILLNRKNRPLGRVLITKGTANAALAHPREVFKAAILAGASAIIAVHNHPSGDPAPSVADIQVTRTLRESARIIGIDLLDHIIIAENASGSPFYSFAEAGQL